MKISIITICYNNIEDIRETINSVIGQAYSNIEYIIVDGGSNDGTLGIIDEYKDRIDKVISEPDHGMYDAINKGIKNSTGEIVGLIHAGDRLYNRNVIEKIAEHFAKHKIDAMYGYSKIVDSDHNIKLVNISPEYSKRKIRMGWMPSHQSIYLRKSLFNKLGYYRLDLKGSADYELFLRYFYFNDLKVKLLKEYIIYFTLGGRSTSSIKNKISSQSIHKKCWKLNGKNPPLLLIPLKMSRKIPQILRARFK